MAEITKTSIKRFYYIANSLGGIVTFGKLDKDSVLTTGQPVLKQYALETELETAIDAINGAGWYANNKSDEQDTPIS